MVVALQRLATGKAALQLVPVGYLRLTLPPTEIDHPAITESPKVQQPVADILQLAAVPLDRFKTPLRLAGETLQLLAGGPYLAFPLKMVSVAAAGFAYELVQLFVLALKGSQVVLERTQEWF